MCGLIAAVNAGVTPELLDTIRHRGPDDSGIDELQVGAHRVSLGHRRLSIVDLTAAGHQPMHAADRSAALVYNGETYNHQDLRDRLGGRAFAGHSDSESILYWLKEHGPSGCRDLNGIFALAFVDVAAQAMYLARDPFGVKPLYYMVQDNRVIAASELAPILELANPTIDPASLALLLRLRYLPAPYTLYAGIRKVRPGHLLRVDLSAATPRIEEQAYAGLQVPARSGLSYAEATDEYARQVEAAVDRQMMSDVEVGILLSGGIDSAVVAHFARRYAGKSLKAFTVGFEGQHQENEIEAARETARVLGLDFHQRVIGIDDFLGSLRGISAMVEEPLATTSIVPMHFLSELAASHVKVVLSGQGADESMAGYGRHRGYHISALLPPAVAGVAGRAARALGIRNEQLLRGLGVAALSGEAERLLATFEVFTPGEIRQLTGVEDTRSAEVLDYVYRTWHCADIPEPAARLLRMDLRMGLADDLLLYTDRITMRHSLECRVPLLDLELIRFIESLPLGYKLGARKGKRIHKAAAARILPREIVERRKLGFQSPTRAWFRDSERLRRVFAEHGDGLHGMLDPAAVDAVIDQHAAGENREKQLFLLLTLMFALERR